MKNVFFGCRPLLLVSLALLSFSSCNREQPAVLVFSKTEGFYHQSIPDGVEAVQKLGEEYGFAVDTTTNAGLFTEEVLKEYAAVIFMNTNGDVLNHIQEAEFERYIQAGGGYAGVHSAAATEYHWGWYGRLVGGYFQDHPEVQEAAIEVIDHQHPSTEHLPELLVRTDEWYSYRNLGENLNVLMTLDEESYTGGTPMGYHPIAWYHEYDGGRAFYTGLGHTRESYTDEPFLDHLLGGIRYAMGDNRRDYSKAKTRRVPEENRFVKTELAGYGELFEPVEMAILPDLDILIAQRRGEILYYKNGTDSLSQAGFLDVYWETDAPGVNAEEGVIGIKADPDFEENRYVYIFYAVADTSLNRISRFRFEDDTLDMESETTILEFYSTRDICCHTGGSLAFDSNGLLYASTGDNSTPFNQPGEEFTLSGYAPLDARPGFEQYDARRSSGNANDLRGKILRIKVNDDGSYDIPEGNLYPPGTGGTRPEIYVQGTRNPYRISVDPKTGYLYWGDVGPDAREDSLGVRGPRGYDEINQAREAGHFGWPFFIADNLAYNEFDFDTGTPGERFDPEHPVNRSPNNTGIEELPPAKPAFIWYPYSASDRFPETGSGGRTSMAGPVFYSDLYPEETRLPDYFDGKLFIYDWIRDWIRVVTMRPNGDFDKMEPFMDGTSFNAISDMELGPDGRLYLLEYGKGWFSQNEDSGLFRIDYNPGNRPPVVSSVEAEENAGILPFDVVVHAEAEDPDGDPLTYRWDPGTGEIIETDRPRLRYTYRDPGDYRITLEVEDSGGLQTTAPPVGVYAGNATPEVSIEIPGNRTFYFPGHPVEYRIRVEDEGPEGVSSGIDPSGLFVTARYTEAEEAATIPEGHQTTAGFMSGRQLVSTLDCRACHHEINSSVGPAYVEVADKYMDSPEAADEIAERIIEGSSGRWGDVAMPAHPELDREDARRIVAWILSLAGREDEEAKSLPASGTVDPVSADELSETGVLTLSASYTDPGGEEIRSLTGFDTVSLINSKVRASAAGDLHNFRFIERDDNTYLLIPDEPGHFSLNQIDLSGIDTIEMEIISQQPFNGEYRFELRLDAPDGPQAGESVLVISGEPSTNEERAYHTVTIDVETKNFVDLHDLFFVSRPAVAGEGRAAVVSLEFVREKASD